LVQNGTDKNLTTLDLSKVQAKQRSLGLEAFDNPCKTNQQEENRLAVSRALLEP
jgi:hypothetical protein